MNIKGQFVVWAVVIRQWTILICSRCQFACPTLETAVEN